MTGDHVLLWPEQAVGREEKPGRSSLPCVPGKVIHLFALSLHLNIYTTLMNTGLGADQEFAFVSDSVTLSYCTTRRSYDHYVGNSPPEEEEKL